ncbi:MAG TPA: hypothetical protein VFB99_20475 [Vicinamibacterales bacterium]|nr:hypothetical protein [Vicinamibacterales bacterium]
MSTERINMKQALGRVWFLDVCANGSVHIRKRGKRIQDGLLPVFSTDTEAQAKTLQVRHCRLARDGSGLYHLNERPSGYEDLEKITAMFALTFRQIDGQN